MTAGDIALSKSELLPSRVEKSEEAETLAGRIFNSIHDAISPSVNLNGEQRKERAQHSDQLATVAADTLAMLPGLRLPAAGLLRATALVKVSDDWSSMSGNFAKDFVEGAALNKVSAYCLPNGTLGRAFSNKLGTGLLAETASFAAAGVGIGSVTTAFRTETWFDEHKQFSALHGLGEMAKAGTVGGVMGAPAGLIGSKIGKLGFSLANEGRISASTALVLSGMGGGYLSGASVGAAQAYLSTGDWRATWRGANEGALTGALSGGIGLLGLSRMGQIRQEPSSERQPNRSISRLEAGAPRRTALPESPEHAVKSSVEKEPLLRRSQDDVRAANLELWKSLEISAAKLRDSDATLKDRVELLGKPTMGAMRFHVTAANAEAVAAASQTHAEFVQKGGMRLVEEPVRIHNVRGVTVTIPETYALKLDEVLKLRLQAAEEVDIYIKGPGHGREVLQARLDLEAHPLRDRAHPADFVQLLDELPDRTLVRDLFIREDRSPNDAWTAKEYEKNFRAAATAGEQDKRITFYGQNRSSLLREYMKHEWSHLLKWTAKDDSTRFDQAAGLEKDGYYISDYSKRNHDENWAEHAASLLSPDSDKFLQTVHSAPLRTVEITRALMKSLGAVPAGRQGIHQSEIASRIAYVQKHIIPEAQEFLLTQLRTGKKDEAVTAAKLLAPIAGEKEFNALAILAKTHFSQDMREAAFNAARERVLQTRSQVSGYSMKPVAPNSAEMRDFLVSQAGGKSREQALSHLSNMQDPQSRFHYDLLTLDQYQGNKSARSVDLLDRAVDAASLKLAWQAALKVSGSNSDARVNLGLRALDRYPRLINEVVDVFAREAQPRTRPFLRDLATHYDERVASRARQGLLKIEMDSRVLTLQKQLSTGSESGRLAAARALAATKDSRAAGYLLDAYLAAPVSEQAGLLKVVKETVNSEVWKFELRQRKMRSPELATSLQALLVR